MSFQFGVVASKNPQMRRKEQYLIIVTTFIREGQCDNNRAGRNNANNIDLNRNFPRQFDEPVDRLKVIMLILD